MAWVMPRMVVDLGNLQILLEYGPFMSCVVYLGWEEWSIWMDLDILFLIIPYFIGLQPLSLMELVFIIFLFLTCN